MGLIKAPHQVETSAETPSWLGAIGDVGCKPQPDSQESQMTTSVKSDAAKAADLRNLETPEPFTPRLPQESPRFVDTRNAATILSLSARTLEKFRI